jgi:hypothetical protein
MTWPEVASDAIKIGVPSLLTGVMTFIVARTSRSHELRKERRRQSQQVLEQMVKRIAAIHSVSKKHWLFKRDELFNKRERTKEWLEESRAVLKEMDRHAVDIEECRAFLLMLGIRSTGALGGFFEAMHKVNLAFDRQPPPTPAEIEDLEDKAVLAYVELIVNVGTAFREM